MRQCEAGGSDDAVRMGFTARAMRAGSIPGDFEILPGTGWGRLDALFFIGGWGVPLFTLSTL